MLYNIYCDESSIENRENQYMIIGALFLKREKRDELKEKIKRIKEKNKYFSEIKWNKVSERFSSFYKEIIDLFFEYSPEDWGFYCIKINRKKVNFKLYHNNDLETGFFKFYYQLLKSKFKNNNSYYIFLDYKPTKLKKRVFILEKFLKFKISNLRGSKIKKVQTYPSMNNIFIQIADLLSGCVNYDNNFKDCKKGGKKIIVDYLSSKLKRKDLSFHSLSSENKFNIFCI